MLIILFIICTFPSMHMTSMLAICHHHGLSKKKRPSVRESASLFHFLTVSLSHCIMISTICIMIIEGYLIAVVVEIFYI